MGFEKYDQNTRGHLGMGPHVTINQQGQCSISAVFRPFLKDVVGVTLFYDAESKKVGLKPAGDLDWPQFKLSGWGKESKDGKRAIVVSVRGFLKYNRLKDMKGRYPAEWDKKEKMLVIQL